MSVHGNWHKGRSLQVSCFLKVSTGLKVSFSAAKTLWSKLSPQSEKQECIRTKLWIFAFTQNAFSDDFSKIHSYSTTCRTLFKRSQPVPKTVRNTFKTEWRQKSSISDVTRLKYINICAGREQCAVLWTKSCSLSEKQEMCSYFSRPGSGGRCMDYRLGSLCLSSCDKLDCNTDISGICFQLFVRRKCNEKITATEANCCISDLFFLHKL